MHKSAHFMTFYIYFYINCTIGQMYRQLCKHIASRLVRMYSSRIYDMYQYDYPFTYASEIMTSQIHSFNYFLYVCIVPSFIVYLS